MYTNCSLCEKSVIGFNKLGDLRHECCGKDGDGRKCGDGERGYWGEKKGYVKVK